MCIWNIHTKASHSIFTQKGHADKTIDMYSWFESEEKIKLESNICTLSVLQTVRLMSLFKQLLFVSLNLRQSCYRRKLAYFLQKMFPCDKFILFGKLGIRLPLLYMSNTSLEKILFCFKVNENNLQSGYHFITLHS